MSNRDFTRRVVAEKALGHEDQARLDACLEASEAVRAILSAMPEEEPSLAWRSALNERLRAASPPRRPRARFLQRAAGGMVAASMAMVAFFALTPQTLPTPDVTDAVIAAHAESVSAIAMGQTAIVEDRPVPDLEIDWTEDDLGAL